MSKGKSEKLHKFPIVLSVKLAECNKFLLNLGGCSPLSPPSTPMARSNYFAKMNEIWYLGCQFSSGNEGKDLSCPFVSGKLLRSFTKYVLLQDFRPRLCS